MTPTFGRVIPVLRMFNLKTTLRYCEHLGCQVAWQEGEGAPRPQITKGMSR